MKLVRAVSRLIVGLTFIFSGFVKIIDPVGFGLVIGEYFKLIGAGELTVFYQSVAVLISSLELLLGISVLLGIRMKISCIVSFAFLSFFTLLTFLLAVFNPISDCGCFGEAIKLTNWQTFYKNLIIIPFATILFFQRKRFVPIAPTVWEWIFAAVYAVFIMGLASYSLRHLPLIDFMEFKVGTNIKNRLEAFDSGDNMPEFETLLIYSKDGKEYTFTIENLPDSTYTFLDAVTRPVTKRQIITRMEFAVSDMQNRYVTDSLLSIEGPLFLVSVPFVERLSTRQSDRIVKISRAVKEKGVPVIILSGSSFPITDKLIQSNDIEATIYHVDFKTLLTLNRSNGGVVYLHNATVTAKWSSAGISSIDLKIFNEDPELIAAEARIREQLSAEIAAVLIIVLIIILRYICRLSYKHKSSKENENRAE